MIAVHPLDPASIRKAAAGRLKSGRGRAEHALLRVRDLSVAYGDHVALRGLNLDVPVNGCVAVLGANGAGKSTLLSAISGQRRPITGQILFGKQRIESSPAHRIAKLGICHILEGRAVFPQLTVAENLRVALGPDRAAWEKVIEQFPVLGARLRQAAGTLSGGEQQMLAMAPAIEAEYRLLLVDELSLGLAPMVVGQLFDVLRNLMATRAISVVIVEQFPERALAIADRAYVLRKGTIAFAGGAQELLGNPDQLKSYYLGGSDV